MKTAYLDCASGISGDMTLGALIDAGADLDAINAAIGSLGWDNVRVTTSQVKKKGFRATQVKIEHEPEHKHRHLHHIAKMIDGSTLNTRQRELAHRIFGKLAEAEAKVHGTSIEKVHFHEVGAVDSICDIVGVAVAWDLLGIQRAVSSAIPTGTGFVEIAHGRCSIPAPATAELLKGIPLAPSSVPHELTTPTGAAILAALVEDYGPVPALRVEAIGYGAGERDLEEQANLLRLLVGESSEQTAREMLVLLETNLDDASGELIGHAIGLLWKAGALDVYTTAIQMKKQRPGVMLSVLCEPGAAEVLEAILLRETTTLGVRRASLARTKLPRETSRIATEFGEVDGVLARLPDGSSRFSPEYESCRLAAERHNVALRTVYEAALRAAPI
jgi:uncharacterized protein (TIGR00299 family) protein